MPWHGTELWVADVNADGSLGSRSLIAGGKEESILRPEWSPSNDLYFASDVTGWCNLYRWREGVIDALCKMDAEFAGSSMSLVPSEYAFESDSKIVCAFNKLGTWHIAKLDTESLKLEELQIPFTDVSRLGLHAYSGKVVFSAGSPTDALSIVELDLDSGNISVLRNSKNIEI